MEFKIELTRRHCGLNRRQAISRFLTTRPPKGMFISPPLNHEKKKKKKRSLKLQKDDAHSVNPKRVIAQINVQLLTNIRILSAQVKSVIDGKIRALGHKKEKMQRLYFQ